MGCSLEDPLKENFKEKARKFAKDLCSCNQGLERIHFYTYTFDFYCSDGKSKGLNVQYESEYYGSICK